MGKMGLIRISTEFIWFFQQKLFDFSKRIQKLFFSSKGSFPTDFNNYWSSNSYLFLSFQIKRVSPSNSACTKKEKLCTVAQEEQKKSLLHFFKHMTDCRTTLLFPWLFLWLLPWICPWLFLWLFPWLFLWLFPWILSRLCSKHDKNESKLFTLWFFMM